MKNFRIVSLLLAASLILAIYIPGALGAPPGKTPAKAGQPPGAQKEGTEGEFPLHITAARLEADQTAGLVVFSGQVKAQYGADTTLYADRLTVYYHPTPVQTPAKTASAAPPAKGAGPPSPDSGPLGDLGGQKIDRIVAQGQVRFVQEDKLATGQEAVYYKDKDQVVLSGNPQVWRGENTLKGDRIVFNLKDKKTLVESSTQRRVEAHLYSSSPAAAGAKASLPLGSKSRKDRQP